MTSLKYPDFKGPAKPMENFDLPRIGTDTSVADQLRLIKFIGALTRQDDGQ